MNKYFLTDIQVSKGFSNIMGSILFYLARDTNLLHYVVASNLNQFLINNDRVKPSMLTKERKRGIKFEKQLNNIIDLMYCHLIKDEEELLKLCINISENSKTYVVDIINHCYNIIEEEGLYSFIIFSEKANAEIIENNIRLYYDMFIQFRKLVIELLFIRFGKNIKNFYSSLVYISDKIPKYNYKYMNLYNFVKLLIKQHDWENIVQDKKKLHLNFNSNVIESTPNISLNNTLTAVSLDNKMNYIFIRSLLSSMTLNKWDYINFGIIPFNIYKEYDKWLKNQKC